VVKEEGTIVTRGVSAAGAMGMGSGPLVVAWILAGDGRLDRAMINGGPALEWMWVGLRRAGGLGQRSDGRGGESGDWGIFIP
jgi:hypothetical protein